MTRLAPFAAGLIAVGLGGLPAAATGQQPRLPQESQQPSQQASAAGQESILHTAIVGSYGLWLGQPGELDNTQWGYGATIRYLGGGMPFGVGLSWMRHKLDVSGTYRTDSEAFRNQITVERLGGDLYYQLPPNKQNNVPYFLAGGGQVSAEGDLVGGNSGEATGAFWEAGMGIINGGSQYTAFALELKYIGSLDDKVRRDDGLIELSMSVGYNW